MGNTEYDFQPLSAENIHHLLPLYEKVFGQRWSIEEIQKKYLADHTGITAQGHFAFLKETPVSFFGAVPMIMKYGNTVEVSAQSCDSMTLSGHTGRGLFTRLGKMTDGLLMSKGVRFIWGFPNQSSLFYIKKPGWIAKESMRCYKISLSQISTRMLLKNIGFLKSYFQKKTNKALERLAVNHILNNSVVDESHGGTLRNEAYYQYKTFTPNYIININDTLIWVKAQGGLLIGDMEVKSEPQLEKTLGGLKTLASDLGLGRVIFQVSPGTVLDKFLSKHYSGFDSWLIAYKNYNSDIPLEKLRFTYGDLDTF